MIQDAAHLGVPRPRLGSNDSSDECTPRCESGIVQAPHGCGCGAADVDITLSSVKGARPEANP